MSQFADFNVATLKLTNASNITQLTSTTVISNNTTALWSDVVASVNNIDEIAQEVVLKEDAENKSISILTDAASDTKYPSVKAVKTYVDNKTADQAQYVNMALEALQSLQTELGNSAEMAATKENLSNKSTSIVTDAASDTKYPSVKAVKTYVDSSKGSLLVIEGESTVTGDILWSCGSCPIEGLFGLCVPNGKINRIYGVTYGSTVNINTIEVKLNAASLDNAAQLVRNLTFEKNTTHSMFYLSNTSESILPFTVNILSLENPVAKDLSGNTVSLTPYIRFRITLEYTK
jgi:hypothetical protein